MDGPKATTRAASAAVSSGNYEGQQIQMSTNSLRAGAVVTAFLFGAGLSLATANTASAETCYRLLGGENVNVA